MTINVACPHEHGDVESQNGHLKRRIKQHLLLRGSPDFQSEAGYDAFLVQVLERANKPRQARLAEELALMGPLPPTRLAEYQEVDALVGRHSTIRVKKVTYSVPSRLIGQHLRVEVHEAVLKLTLGRERLLELPRARGRGAVINFRHVVGPLLRKPGAFLNYQHREQLYPTVAYRAGYDRLVQDHGQRPGIIEYLHLLKLAVEYTVETVEAAMAPWLAGARKWRAGDVRAALSPAPVAVPCVVVSAEALRTLPADFVKQHRVLPLEIRQGTLHLATPDSTSERVLDDVRLLSGLELCVSEVPAPEILEKIAECYQVTVEQLVQHAESRNLHDIEVMANEPTMVNLVNVIISSAVRERASDIHLVPSESSLQLCYRVDGLLQEKPPPPKQLHAALVSRIKIMADMNIAERFAPQDGHIQIHHRGSPGH